MEYHILVPFKEWTKFLTYNFIDFFLRPVENSCPLHSPWQSTREKQCNCRKLPESVRFRALVIRRPQISRSRVGNNFGVIGMPGPPFVLSWRFMQADVPRMCCITVLRRGRGRCTKKAVCSTSSMETRQRGGVVSTHLRLMKHWYSSQIGPWYCTRFPPRSVKFASCLAFQERHDIRFQNGDDLGNRSNLHLRHVAPVLANLHCCVYSVESTQRNLQLCHTAFRLLPADELSYKRRSCLPRAKYVESTC